LGNYTFSVRFYFCGYYCGSLFSWKKKKIKGEIMNKKEMIKEMVSLDIKDSNNHGRISELLSGLRDIFAVEQYRKDIEMMKETKMEHVI